MHPEAFRNSTRKSTTDCSPSSFMVVAANMTAKLASCWTYPRCMARELAVRRLLDQIEVTKQTYDLDLELPAHRRH